MTCATPPLVLAEILTDSQLQTVKKSAQRTQDIDQLPIIAWAMGFVSLEQLDRLLRAQP